MGLRTHENHWPIALLVKIQESLNNIYNLIDEFLLLLLRTYEEFSHDKDNKLPKEPYQYISSKWDEFLKYLILLCHLILNGLHICLQDKINPCLKFILVVDITVILSIKNIKFSVDISQ